MTISVQVASGGVPFKEARVCLIDKNRQEETLLNFTREGYVSCVVIGIGDKEGLVISAMKYKAISEKEVKSFLDQLSLYINEGATKKAKSSWDIRINVLFDKEGSPKRLTLDSMIGSNSNAEIIKKKIDGFIKSNRLYEFSPKPMDDDGFKD